MTIKPMVRNNICLNAHPAGCQAEVERQIEYAREKLSREGGPAPRLALVIGCSSGYGLASRIACAFGYKTATAGVSFEKEPSEKHSGTPGFYNNLAFDNAAKKAGVAAITINGDAFSDAVKAETAKALREAAARANAPAKVDLIVYSLASPVRTDPKTGVLYKSVIKPIGAPFSGVTLNIMDGTMQTTTAESATEEEIRDTIKVMGGEDWELWMEALEKEGLLGANTQTVAYTYIGPEHSWPIYKNGTIGRAKEDLERAAAEINKKYDINNAWISVNKALVTRSSAVIPVIPLYISCLFRVMKEKGLHEGCIEQIVRLYRNRLYREDSSNVPVDKDGRVRLDDWEMREDVQNEVNNKMKIVTLENVYRETDIAGFKHDFLSAHGFDVEGVNYE